MPNPHTFTGDPKLPFLVKAIFIANRKGLLRDWKTLMTDNDLDLNDLIP